MNLDGCLYLHNNPKLDLADKVRVAAALYRQKYGRDPDVCYIHPVAEHEANIDGIKIIPSEGIIKNHFWLANEDRRKA